MKLVVFFNFLLAVRMFLTLSEREMMEQASADLDLPIPISSFQQSTPTKSYCKFCMFFCPSPQKMKDHLKICKSASGNTPASEADASETTEGRSLSDVPVDPSRPFRCTKCGRSYQVMQSLQRHRWKCDQSRPMPCTICGAIFYRADRLLHHVRGSHSIF